MAKAGSTISSACSICGASFDQVVPTSGRRRLTCSSECRRARKAKWNKENSKNHNRSCVVCRAPFLTSNLKTRCCSRACGKALADHAKRVKSIAKRIRICQVCDQSFLMHRPSAKARHGLVREGRYCSRACAAAALRKPVQLGLFDKASPTDRAP